MVKSQFPSFECTVASFVGSSGSLLRFKRENGGESHGDWLLSNCTNSQTRGSAGAWVDPWVDPVLWDVS
jgi:hypothetical protein